jgi:acetoin utilization deacetylase AcuC-like enzyme
VRELNIIYDGVFTAYRHPGEHPERPERVSVCAKELSALDPSISFIRPHRAERSDLLLVHEDAYISSIEHRRVSEVDDETPVHENIYLVASTAAGAAIDALKLCRSGINSLSLSRPPGHHAFPSRGGGFCYFNNAAIACRKIPGRYAILDIDVHHGNGTSDIFYDDDTVLYISTHQEHIYPGTGRVEETGAGKGAGYNLNIPLPSSSGDATYECAMNEIIMPVLRAFSPDAVIISLGVDAHYTDPLATLSLSTKCYCNMLLDVIKNFRTCILLEGGYNPLAVSDVICALYAATKQLHYVERYSEVQDLSCIGREALNRAKRAFSRFWPLE